MTVDLDHYCARCGSMLDIRIEVVPEDSLANPAVNVKVRPCDHCITRYGDPVQIVEVEKKTSNKNVIDPITMKEIKDDG